MVLAEMESKGEYVDVNGVKVFYREAGSGRDMILIHGFGSNTVTWEKVMPPLAQKFHLYAIDVLGFGLTERPLESQYYSYDSYVKQVKGFMDVKGIESAILAGNSMGGAISLHCALEYPEQVDKLILIDSGGYPLKLPIFLSILKTPIIGDIAELFQARWVYEFNLKDAYYVESPLSDKWVDYYYAPFTVENSSYGPQQFLRSGNIGKGIDGEIEKISQPTLIIWGENDSWIPLDHAHRFNRDIKGSRLVIIPECGLVPEEERPDEVVKAILDFT